MLPRGYRESYAPGSTFKVVTAAAAFDHAPELTTKDYPTLRALDIPRTEKDLPNFGGSACGGTVADLSPRQLQHRLRPTRPRPRRHQPGCRSERVRLWRTDLRSTLPAAARSRFPDPSEFERNEPGLAFSAIGQQNVSATPLQMALVAAAIANNGSIMTPHVLDNVRDEQGSVIRRYNPTQWREATSAATANAVKQMMIEVARRGTATRAQISGIEVAAKTGTAQTVGNNAHAWLISFAPADAPKVAVAVIVESQPGLGDVTGGRIAAPIAQRVMRAALGL